MKSVDDHADKVGNRDAFGRPFRRARRSGTRRKRRSTLPYRKKSPSRFASPRKKVDARADRNERKGTGKRGFALQVPVVQSTAVAISHFVGKSNQKRKECLAGGRRLMMIRRPGRTLAAGIAGGKDDRKKVEKKKQPADRPGRQESATCARYALVSIALLGGRRMARGRDFHASFLQGGPFSSSHLSKRGDGPS